MLQAPHSTVSLCCFASSLYSAPAKADAFKAKSLIRPPEGKCLIVYVHTLVLTAFFYLKLRFKPQQQNLPRDSISVSVVQGSAPVTSHYIEASVAHRHHLTVP